MKINYDNLRSCSCRNVRILVCLGLLSSCGLGTLRAAERHTFTVVNVRPAAATVTTAHFAYPVGLTVFPLDGAPASLLSDLGADWSVTVDAESCYVVDIGAVLGGFTVSSTSEANMLPAYTVGLGAGFLWFGFGWILRLTKRTGEI